jgi:hypothetical protein
MSTFEADEYLQALTPVYYSVPSKEADRSAVGHSRQKAQGSYGKDRLSHFLLMSPKCQKRPLAQLSVSTSCFGHTRSLAVTGV